ncbi:MAG: Actin-like protein ATPase involved in cell division-like protein [Candidatus Saccharibacteria bacterium]|nr:Actin-like protein ATPase involved in cell division-like protein [Candidatus Saccharibacteria bacterium]
MDMLDKFKTAGGRVTKRALEGAGKASASVRAKANKKSSDEYLVALDIGTEFVKALIGKIGQDGEIEIIGVGRAHQGLSDMQAGAIADIASVVENCDKALNEAESKANVSVRTAIIGIAGELVKGTTTTVRVSRKEASKPLDVAEMEKVINMVQRRAETRAKEQLAWELGGKAVEVRLVNSALVSIEIDGYPVTNPIGFQGKDVVVQLYTAFAPMIHIGALEKTAQELDLDLLAVAAEPFAVARAIIGNNPNQNLSAILMDVGGGTTDIAVINDGGVQGTKMFGIGGRAYTRAIERELGVEFEQAEELKVGLSTNKVPSQKRPAIEGALNKTADTWIAGIELALAEFTKLDHLPHRMFLCGGGSSLDLLMDRLEQAEWYKTLPFTRKPSVHLIKPGQVAGIKDTTDEVNDHTFITAMGLLRVGMDTLQFSKASGGSIKDKLDKMLSV